MRPTASSAVLALALVGAPSLVSASGDAYEWGGSFDVSDYDTVYWIAQKVDGDYVDPTMNIYIASASSDNEKALEAAEEVAEPLLEAASCTSWTGASTLTPSSSSCFNLVFDTTDFETTYEIDTTGVDYLAIFAEHVPTEFERTTHYLVSSDGDDIEPVHELPEDEQDKVRFTTFFLVHHRFFLHGNSLADVTYLYSSSPAVRPVVPFAPPPPKKITFFSRTVLCSPRPSW